MRLGAPLPLPPRDARADAGGGDRGPRFERAPFSASQVICEKADRSDIPDIDKKKYLVPADLTVGQFIYVIRKRIKLPPERAIFLFVDNMIPSTSSLMSVVYEVQKDEDGFLYITYSGENTFGGAVEVRVAARRA